MGEDPAARPRGRPRNDALIARARRLRAEGHADKAIGEQLGVARNTVTRWLGPARPQGRPRADVDLAAVAAARADGASWREVEERTGVNDETARRRSGRPGQPGG